MGIIARQATLTTLLAYMGIGLGFVNVVLLYPKVLQADEFGLTRLLVSIAAVAAQVAQLGAENTVIRYFPYFRDPARSNRGLLGMVLLFGGVMSLVAMVVLGASHGLLTDMFSDRNALYETYGLLVLPLVLSEIYFILLRSYSRSIQRTVQPSFMREFLLRLLQTALILYQAWKPMPFGLFMVIYTAIFLVCTLALVVDLRRAGQFDPGWSHRRLPARLRKSMVAYGLFTLSATIAGVLLGNIDQLMIGLLIKDALPHVGHYAVAFYFGSVIYAPARSLNQVAVPLLAQAWKRGDVDLIGSLYKRSALVQSVVGGFLFLLVWANLDDLFRLLPLEYAEAAPVALIIGAAYLLTSAIGLSSGIISMSRAFRLDAFSSLAMLAINLVAGFFLIRSMGIAGAAWATLLALATVNIYRTWSLYRRYGLWPFTWRMLLVPVLILLSMLLVVQVPFMGRPIPDMLLRTGLLSVLFWPVAHWLRLTPELSGIVRRAISFQR